MILRTLVNLIRQRGVENVCSGVLDDRGLTHSSVRGGVGEGGGRGV